MNERERPPPYNEGFSNDAYGKPYSDAEDFKPITLEPQRQELLHQQPAYQYAPAPVPPVFPILQPANQHHTSVIVVGNGGLVPGCPVCHNGKWTGTYSCCAWLWCICCFPIGLVCCLCMRKKKCTHCGHTVG